MAKVNYNKEFELGAYSPTGEFLGIIRTQYNLLDFLVQIKEEHIEGYYVINLESGVRSDINENGMITDPSFSDGCIPLLTKLLGF